MGLRASIPTRRAAAVLIIVAVSLSLTITRAIAQASERVAIIGGQSTVDPFVATLPISQASAQEPSREARVLLLGDSVMDQQGGAAAFLLQQAGVDARAIGIWGSGLLTVDQYDYGKTKSSGMWFARARAEVDRMRPDLVGVYLNHNYWPPFPHDANGRAITDLWSEAGQSMIRRQARAFITLLRSRGASVFFVTPIPSGPSAIWHAYEPVLRAMDVPVADSASPLANADGTRAETKAACDGSQLRVRPERDLHLTRFGAGRAGTALATYIAARLHVELRDIAAPGDRTVALVPAADARGYWLVACDGSVYHFGEAQPLGGAHHAVAGHGGVVAAARTPTGGGLWLVSADGTIAALGDAPSLAFTTRATAPVTGATAVPNTVGLWATTVTGEVLRAGFTRSFGNLTGAATPVVGIAATPDGRGYVLAAASGQVHGFGSARVRGDVVSIGADAPIVGIAPAADGGGYWLTDADGRVFTTGTARFCGGDVWEPSSEPWAAVAPSPGPTAGVAARPGSNAGYWVFGTTGRVVARGDARAYGGDNNLALFTQ
jgi:hypothetical protein